MLMIVQEELLDRLERLLPGQFDEVLLRLEISFSYIPETRASRADRAIGLIRLLGQQKGGLARLQRLLDDLDWFKEFLPEGAYPVGQELLKREEARVRQAMEEAAARGEDSEDYRVTPEKFYTFRPEAAWLGVFREWDSPRSFYPELFRQVVSGIHGRNRCPAAAIVGTGGSGKSVAMRRLAVDLANHGYKVWWVDEPERLLRFGLSQTADAGDGPLFLLVDEIQSLEGEYVRRFQRDVQKSRSLILVVAGRNLPPAFRGRVRPGAGLFVPDVGADSVSILDKVAEVIPDWADTAKQMAAESLRQARLIRILWVLARRKAASRDLEELEKHFLEILADDLNRIRSVLPGLAEAVIDAAAVYEVGCQISRKTFTALADYHQSGASIPKLLEEITANPRWEALAPLLSYAPIYDVWRFHHDELVEGLILAGQRGLLTSRVVGDNAWRKATLETIINRGSGSSSSYTLGGFVRNCPGLVGKELALRYIRQLLTAGNGHHTYLRLIVDERLALKQDDQLELLLNAARIAPFNPWFWGAVWGWIQCHYHEEEHRADVLERLYKEGCQADSILIPLLDCLPPAKACTLAKQWLADLATVPNVLCRCIDLLGEEAKDEAKRLLKETKDKGVLCRCIDLLGEEAKPAARTLLADKHTASDVLCRCIDLLGEEAKPAARMLLTDKATASDVLCRCIDLLGEEVRPFAIEQLDAWTHRSPSLLARCLQVAGEIPQAQKAADEMLAAWDKRVPKSLRVAALRAPFDTQLRIQRAREVLNDWHRQHRRLAAAALTAFWNDPEAVTEYCRAILGRWHKEVLYQQKRRLPEYTGHIIKALSHPSLRQEACKAVQDMLAEEARSPGFLSTELRRQVENMIQGNWPPWTASKEKTS